MRSVFFFFLISKISKPVMEKRRRERINSSLETLRLLMLENIDDEKLKNPKVEKAEILESVVQFLKTENEVKKRQRAMKRVREQPPSSSHYQEGMRSCLLRVSHFIASKTQEPETTAGLGPLQMPPTHLSGPGQLQRVLMSSPPTGPGPSPHHLPHLHRPYLSQVTSPLCDTRSPLCTMAFSPGAECVWRPWPQ
uniref:Hairy-related 5 n=1 Tax=Sphaeramia orbicularis TaxID=375764 RepID=A0A672YPH7_9TELE